MANPDGLNDSTTMIAESPAKRLDVLPEEQKVDITTIPFGSLQVLVESQALDLVRPLSRIYSGAITPSVPGGVTNGASERRTVYKVSKEGGDQGAGAGYTVSRDGEVHYRHYSAEGLINCLEWDISSVASKSLDGYHRIHAGALAHNGRGVILPGASGSGKSTLSAALALHGFTYCSDEYAMIGPDARLYPFPKIISLKPGGWQQIVLDFPGEVSLLGWPNVSANGVRLVKPPILPDEHQTRTGYSIDYVILPSYQPGQRTALEPVPRSRALKELVEQSLDLQIRGKEGLEMLVNLVQQTDCYSLSICSLKEASERLKELTL